MKIQNQIFLTYTNPDELKQFVEETGVLMLAPTIGTMHGYYNMINESGDGIAAEIKPFLLADPALIH